MPTEIINGVCRLRLAKTDLMINGCFNRELGKTKTAIDLGCSSLTPDQLAEIEQECNEAIRNHVNVIVHVYDSAKDPELQQVSRIKGYWRRCMRVGKEKLGKKDKTIESES